MRNLTISSLSLLLPLLLPTSYAIPQIYPRGVGPPQIPPNVNVPVPSTSQTSTIPPDSQVPVPANDPSSPVIGSPNYRLPDPCGPRNANGQPNGIMASRSTCNAIVSASLPASSPFKLSCQTDTTGYTLNRDSCRAAVNAACALLTQATNPTHDQWVWAPASSSSSSSTTTALNCTLGFWAPSNGALVPSTARCRRDIYARMIDGCATNVASVNLQRLPHRTPTERDTGEAVDAAYPSYIIVAQNWVQDAVT